jgi:hypothetical protein
VRSHGTLNLGAVLLAAWVLTGTPVPIASTARPVLPTLGAAVALGIGAVVALLLMRAGPDAIDSAWPIAALVGPTVTGWWVGRWHRTPLDRPVAATVAMAVGTIHVAAATTVLILALEGGSLGMGIVGAAIMLAFGLVLGGFLVLIATGPCAVLWLALLRLFAPRPAPAAPGIVR